jgi:DNA-binding NarL/FixJ family response regulator
MPIRTALGEDSLIVRERLRPLLAVDPEVEIVAAVAEQPSLRQACDEVHPNVMLSDIRMPPHHTDGGGASGGDRQGEAAARQRRVTPVAFDAIKAKALV